MPKEPEQNPTIHPKSANTFHAETYVHQVAQLHQLDIPPEQMPGVVNNFERIHAIAQFVLGFPLPDTLESAPRFEP